MESARSGALRVYGHNIRSLDIYVNNDILREFLELAPPSFSYMTSLRFVGCVSEDGLIADLIRRCTGQLEHVAFSMSWYGRDNEVFCFGPESVKAFLRHGPTIESLFAKNTTFNSVGIQRLLCSAPKLKTFQLISDRHMSAQSPCLQAADVVGEDWACTALESFWCPIRGVPRPDIDSIVPGLSEVVIVLRGSRQESIDLQRQVYAQLGRLVHLRELRLNIGEFLGHDSRIHYQFDCLAMTLKSGLGLMHGLKNLRSVVLYEMLVGFGWRELPWVHECWPLVGAVAYEDF